LSWAVVCSVVTMALDDVTAAARAVLEQREALDEALARRDAAIRSAFREGQTIGAIAQAASLTNERVSSILNRPFGQSGRPGAQTRRRRPRTE
jgi:hypothetical protein